MKTSIDSVLATTPWLRWVLAYYLPMSVFFICRLVALSAIVDATTADDDERIAGNKIAGVLLGVLEDFVTTTLLLLALVVLDVVILLLTRLQATKKASEIAALRVAGAVSRFVFVWLLVFVAVVPFVADTVLVRRHGSRFTIDASNFNENGSEWTSGQVAAAIVSSALVALLFSLIYTRFIQRMMMNALIGDGSKSAGGWDQRGKFAPIQTAREGTNPVSPGDASTREETTPDATSQGQTAVKPRGGKWRRCMVALLAYVLVFVITLVLAHAASSVISAVALNATLNAIIDMTGDAAPATPEPSPTSSTQDPTVTKPAQPPAAIAFNATLYLETDTEMFELAGNSTLYRRTTGFKGPLAFDVAVDQNDLPNVLIIGIESHRSWDSLYLSNNTARAKNIQKAGLTLTPQFDRWAKKGIAFNNMWSSWQTSRSLEAVFFGQIGYDDPKLTGTSSGRVNTELSGMPQFFKQRGYDTVFTYGSDATYDQWHLFLPAHGFDTLLGDPEMRKIAEDTYGITKEQWKSESRDYQWGIHDDLTFSMLGDMMLDDIKQQQERVAKNEAKKPFFRAHYTISSHVPFRSTPSWFADTKLPDFSPLCQDLNQEQCDFTTRYAKLRYFSDMELGKFLDRMEKEGVLKDTIVIVTGDHGISPEKGMDNMVDAQADCQRVVAMLIAEGRLGDAAGMMFDDAVMQYDWLNTIMDIIGLPAEGFMQTGVGRSLKRAVEWGTRLAWVNNPKKKLSVVRGHERYVFDKELDDEGLYDTVLDPLEETDLLVSRNATEKAWWATLQTAGRNLNAYFKQRWDYQCLTQAEC